MSANAAQPTLWSERTWRDPWEQINRELEPVLRELGYGHVREQDGNMRFAPLHVRCLAAFAELRALRERVGRYEAERDA